MDCTKVTEPCIDTVRENILNVLLVAICTFSVIPLGSSLFRVVAIGWQPVMYIHILVYGFILITTVCRQKISYAIKSMVLVIFALLIGCVATVNMGLVGSGIMFMVFAVIFATMFRGVRYGIGIIVICFMILIGVALAVNLGWISFNLDMNLVATSFSSWISKILAFALFSTMLIMSLGRLINYLMDSSRTLHNRTLELQRTNSDLQEKIAENTRSKAALKKSEARYRLLAENATDLIWISDLDLNMKFVSPSVVRALGYSIEEFLSQKAADRLAPESFSSAVRILKEELEKESDDHVDPYRSQVIELESYCKDGTSRWSETKLSFIRDAQGTAIEILGVGRDISIRKQAEKEKRQLEKQLRQTHKMEAIGTMAGGIAHDFNNILSAIIGYTELIQMSAKVDKRTAKYLKDILKAGNRAKDLVKQILTFSRQTEQKFKPVSVNIIVNEALGLLRASLPTTIEIRQNILSDSLVMGDSTQIHQILMNLCANAGHAMQESGGVLEVNITDMEIGQRLENNFQDLEPGAYIKLSVRDSGQGITPNILENVFDPFFSTKERGEGTGLGLAVDHGIVKSHGGTIHAVSELGHGSVFEVLLPTIGHGPEKSEPISRPILARGREQILLVDDEPAIVDIGEQMLLRLGYKVETRTNSLEALDLFRARPDRFDMVITDMTMPQMTGDKLAQEINTIRKNVPVILCTGFSNQITADGAQEMGIKGFLMKPVVLADMARVVRNLLDQVVVANEAA